MLSVERHRDHRHKGRIRFGGVRPIFVEHRFRHEAPHQDQRRRRHREEVGHERYRRRDRLESAGVKKSERKKPPANQPTRPVRPRPRRIPAPTRSTLLTVGVPRKAPPTVPDRQVPAISA